MLNILRKQAQSTLIQGLVLIIAIVFIFWGVGANMNNNRNSAATVNGREISFQDYQRAYERTVENFRQQFGGQVPPGLLEGMGIKRQVLAQLVQSELLRQGGDEMGLVVSDLAVQREIEKMAAFQENGHFSLERYKSVLSQNRLTPTGFEMGLKADLQRQRVTQAVGGFAVVPDSMLRDWFAFTDEEIRLAYAAFTPADFENTEGVNVYQVAAVY
jgi:peptidyl-prolyl cis-trans isomerase D